MDPIDEIRRIANEMKQSVRLASSVQRKRLNRLNHRKKNTSFIITDINLFTDELAQIQVNYMINENTFIREMFFFITRTSISCFSFFFSFV